MELVDNLNTIKLLIENTIQDIEDNPKEFNNIELIKKLKEIDSDYQCNCETIDSIVGDEKGTTYSRGMNSEFYIEGLIWHEISLLLRKL